MEPSQTSSLLTDGPWGRAGLAASEESIKLIPKIRPSTTPGLPDYVQYVGHKALALSAPGAENALWDFDFVASPHTRQSSFFRVAGRPMADHFLAFYNAAIIAYGQTGSGKTHTMLGAIPSGGRAVRGASAGVLDDMPREAGLIPRVLDYIFQRIAADSQGTTTTTTTPPGTSAPKQPPAPAHTAVPRPLPQPPQPHLSPSGSCLTPIAENTRPRTGRSGIPTPPPTTGLPRTSCFTPPPASPGELPGPPVHGPGSASGPPSRSRVAGAGPTQYLVKASMLQIYQEVVTDLLNPRPVRLQLRESMQGGVTVVGLSEVTVRCASEALQLLRVGTSHRAVAETASNPVSSRSHCILTLHMEAKDTMDTGVVRIRRSRLQLVDLAGSERTTKHVDYGSTRQKEANAINKSLSTLCLVIARLSDRTRSQGPVPYRDSKLTFLLQDCLGGNAKTLFIANLNPSPSCASETNMTLGFALRAKRVRNRAVVNEDHQGDAVVLQGEVRRLREELSIFRTLHAEEGPPKGLQQLSAWRDQAAARASELHTALELNTELEAKLVAMEAAHARLRTDHVALEEQCEAQRCEMSALEATVEQCEDELLLLRARPTVEQYKALEEQLRATSLERDQARSQQSELAAAHSKLRAEYDELAALVEASLQERGLALQRAQEAITALACGPAGDGDGPGAVCAAAAARKAEPAAGEAAADTDSVTGEALLPGEDLQPQQRRPSSLFGGDSNDDDEVGLPAELELGMGHVAEQLQLQQQHHSALEEAYATLVAQHATLAADHAALVAEHQRQLAELQAANDALAAFSVSTASTASSSSPSRGSRIAAAAAGSTAGSVAAAASSLRGRCRAVRRGSKGEAAAYGSPRQQLQEQEMSGAGGFPVGVAFRASHPGSCGDVGAGGVGLEAVLESPEENDDAGAYAQGTTTSALGSGRGRGNSGSLPVDSTCAVGSPSAQVCFASPPDSLMADSPGHTSASASGAAALSTARSTAHSTSNASSSSHRLPSPAPCGAQRCNSAAAVASLRGSWGVRRWRSQGSGAAIAARSVEMWRSLNVAHRPPATPRDRDHDSDDGGGDGGGGGLGSARSYNSAPPTTTKAAGTASVRQMVRQLDALLSHRGAGAAAMHPDNEESRSRGTLVRVNPLFECRRGDESRMSLESREAVLGALVDGVGAAVAQTSGQQQEALTAASGRHTGSSASSGAMPANSDSVACELPLPPNDQLTQSPLWPTTAGQRDAGAAALAFIGPEHPDRRDGALLPAATAGGCGSLGSAGFLPLQEIQPGNLPPPAPAAASLDTKPNGRRPDLIAALPAGLQADGTPCSRPLAARNRGGHQDGADTAAAATAAVGSPSTPRCLPPDSWAGPVDALAGVAGRRSSILYGDTGVAAATGTGSALQVRGSIRGSGSWLPLPAASSPSAASAQNDENSFSMAAAVAAGAGALQATVGGSYPEHPAIGRDGPRRAHQPLSELARAGQSPSVIGISAPSLQAVLPPRPTSASAAAAAAMLPAFSSAFQPASGRRSNPTATTTLSASSAAAAVVVATTTATATTEDAPTQDALQSQSIAAASPAAAVGADGLLPAEGCGGDGGGSARGSPATRRLREELLRQQVLVENVAQLEDELARRLAGEAQLRRELQTAVAEAQHAGEQMAVLVQLNSALVDDLTQRDERLRGFEELLTRLYGDLKFIVREVLHEQDGNTPLPAYRAATTSTTASSPPVARTTAQDPEDDDGGEAHGVAAAGGPSKGAAALAATGHPSASPSAATPVAQLRFSPTRAEEAEDEALAAAAAGRLGSASPGSSGAEDATPQYLLPRVCAAGSSGRGGGSGSRDGDGDGCTPAGTPSPGARTRGGSASGASPLERPGSVMALGVMRLIARLRDGLSDRAQRVTRLEAQLSDTRSRLESIEEDLCKKHDAWQDDENDHDQPQQQQQQLQKQQAKQGEQGQQKANVGQAADMLSSAALRASAAAVAQAGQSAWDNWLRCGQRSSCGVAEVAATSAAGEQRDQRGCNAGGGRDVGLPDVAGSAAVPDASLASAAATPNPTKAARDASAAASQQDQASSTSLREASLQAQLRNRELQVLELVERTEQLETALQEALAERDTRVSELQTQANRLASSLQAQLRSRDTQIGELQGQAAELDAALRGASAEAARCRQQATEAVARCERYGMELRGAEYREEMLMNKLRQMEVMFLHRGEEVGALREELAVAADQLAGMRAQAVAAQVEAAAARQSAAALQDALDDLRRSVGFQKASAAGLGTSGGASSQQLHSLRQSFSQQLHNHGHAHADGLAQMLQLDPPPPPLPPLAMPPLRAVASSGGAPPTHDPWQIPMPYFSRSDGGAVEGYATAAYQPSGSWAPMDSSRDYAGHYDNLQHHQYQQHNHNHPGGRPLGRNSGRGGAASQMMVPSGAGTNRGGPLGPPHGKGANRGVPPGHAGSQDPGGNMNKGTWVQRFLCRKGVTVDGSPAPQQVTAILTPAKWRPKGMTGIVLRQWVPSNTNNQRRAG